MIIKSNNIIYLKLQFQINANNLKRLSFYKKIYIRLKYRLFIEHTISSYIKKYILKQKMHDKGYGIYRAFKDCVFIDMYGFTKKEIRIFIKTLTNRFKKDAIDVKVL